MFLTHAELDHHVYETSRLGHEDPHNADRMNLLKGFDRAFHMRHESGESEGTAPHENGCPWGLPTRI